MSRFTLIDCEQNTPEWFAARMGRATGSKAACILAQSRTKGQEAVTRRDYRVQLVTERLTGEPQESDFDSPWMRAGRDNEPMARLEYEAVTGCIVRTVGFAAMTELAAGCSPDGLIEDNPEGLGLMEAKCPKPAVHLRYLMEARVPPEYVSQCTHNLYVFDAAFVDFVSFCPTLPPYASLFHVRAYRSEFDLKAYDLELRRFLRDTDDLEERLRQREKLLKAAA